MPFVKRSGVSSELDQKLKKKRRKIIEEERIRILRESLMLFYDKLKEILLEFLNTPELIIEMAIKARKLSKPNATDNVAKLCIEAAYA